jgi:hypothetical protein
MINFIFQFIMAVLAKLFWFLVAFVIGSVPGLWAYLEALAVEVGGK